MYRVNEKTEEERENAGPNFIKLFNEIIMEFEADELNKIKTMLFCKNI